MRKVDTEKADESHDRAFEMKCIRQILRAPVTHKRTNKLVLKRDEKESTRIHNIQEIQVVDFLCACFTLRIQCLVSGERNYRLCGYHGM